jgi:hypothetical protein
VNVGLEDIQPIESLRQGREELAQLELRELVPDAVIQPRAKGQ